MAGTDAPLAAYREEVYARCHYTCVFCGLDGRRFDTWMQLSVCHLRPPTAGANDGEDNVVVGCRSCVSITSKMRVKPETPLADVLRAKRARVAEHRTQFHEFWLKNVAPRAWTAAEEGR